MLTEHLITYALDENNRPVNIDDVPRGIACNCTCAACGERLIAKKGDVKIHHFAHVSGADCVHGVQTALHLAAKRYIEKNQFLHVPKLFLEYSSNHIIPIELERNLRADRIELEKRIGDIIPDITIYSGNKIYLVEVFVTHQVDEVKLERIQKIGLPTLEVNLCDVSRENFETQLFRRISRSSPYVRWIYHPLYEKYDRMFREEATCHKVDYGDIYDCPLVFSSYPVYAKKCERCKYYLRSEYLSTIGCWGVWCTGERKICLPGDFTSERQNEIQAEIQTAKREHFRKLRIESAWAVYRSSKSDFENLVSRLHKAIEKIIDGQKFDLEWMTHRLEYNMDKIREQDEKRRIEEEKAERKRIWQNRINEFVGKYSTVVCPICKKHMRLMYDGHDWEYYLGCSSKPSCGTKQEMCPKCGYDLWFRDDEEGFRMTCDNPECDYSVEFPDNQEQFNEYEQIAFF